MVLVLLVEQVVLVLLVVPVLLEEPVVLVQAPTGELELLMLFP